MTAISMLIILFKRFKTNTPEYDLYRYIIIGIIIRKKKAGNNTGK